MPIFIDALGRGEPFAVSIAVAAMFLAVVFVYLFSAAVHARARERERFLESRRRAAYRTPETPASRAIDESVRLHIRSLRYGPGA